MRRSFILFCFLFALMISCGDSDEDAPPARSPTAPQIGETPSPSPPGTAQLATPTPDSSTPAPTLRTDERDEWDERAVWEAYLRDSNVYDECVPDGFEVSCVVDVAVRAGASEQSIHFIEQNETILVHFEELGAVDFGEVSWLGVNMGRPEPVFLNGDFGLLYYGSVIPEDWRSADPSYEALPLDEDGFGPFPWAEYSMLAEAYTDASGQHMIIETLIQDCRACPPLGFLALEAVFSDRDLVGVTVLPMRCDSEVFQVEPAEGPCVP